MYNVYRVSNLALWLQQINKLYLLTKPPPAAQMHTTRLFGTYSSIFLRIFSEPTHNVRTFKALKNHICWISGLFRLVATLFLLNSVQYSIVSDNINQAIDELAVTFGTQRCLLTQATLHCTKSNTQPINTTELWCTNHHTVYIDSHDLLLVHGQVTIIFVVSVCLSVCLFVCAEFFSAIFDPIWIKLGHVTCPGLVVSPRI